MIYSHSTALGKMLLLWAAFSMAGCTRDYTRLRQPRIVVGDEKFLYVLVPHERVSDWTDETWREAVIKANARDAESMFDVYVEYSMSLYPGDSRLQTYEPLLLGAALGEYEPARRVLYQRLIESGEDSDEWRRWGKQLKKLGSGYSNVVAKLKITYDSDSVQGE